MQIKQQIGPYSITIRGCIRGQQKGVSDVIWFLSLCLYVYDTGYSHYLVIQLGIHNGSSADARPIFKEEAPLSSTNVEVGLPAIEI